MLTLLFRGILLTLLSCSFALAQKSYSAGALIFKVNCSQCHGSIGLGDGYYPNLSKLGNTNLLDITKDKSEQSLSRAISEHSIHENMHEFNSLDPSINKKLIDFLVFYFEKPQEAFSLLNKTTVYALPSFSVGESTYKRRCLICHGIKGDGKGRLSKIIKKPSPYDLRQSYISDELIRQIIEDGGIKQGKNLKDTMPSFKGKISNFELESLILYVKDFRIETQL